MPESPAAGAATQQITLSGTAATTTPVETAIPPGTGASAVITSTGAAAGSTAPTVVTPLVIGTNPRGSAEDTIPGPASAGGQQ